MYIFFAFVDADSCYFTLKIHHGGEMVEDGNSRSYVGGLVSFLKNQDADKMLILELRCISKDIGYIKPPMFFRLSPKR